LRRLSRNELAFLAFSLIVAIGIWLFGGELDGTGLKVLPEPIKPIALFWGSLSFREAGNDFHFNKDH
jgi:hypothetical protein